MGTKVNSKKIKRLKDVNVTNVAKVGDYATQLDIEVAGTDYQPAWKDFPPDLPEYYGSDPITWFNNFGVSGPTQTGNSQRLKQSYKVRLNAPPAGSTLCIYDATQPAESRVLVLASETGRGKMQYVKETVDGITYFAIVLDLVDPPVGSYP